MATPSLSGLGPLDGLLLVDKPSGPTSHDIVAQIRRRFRIPKVGHGGTLDPMATGLLVILLGKGTKVSERVMGHDKTYEGVFRLGIETDSQDADGRVVAEKDPSAVTAEQIAAQMSARLGDQMQTPPMVSAIKLNGVPLYKLARKGQTVERAAKLVHLYRFDLLEFTPPDVRFVGWGQEDDAWACALKGLVGPPMRGAHDLWHLWHTPQERMSRSEGNEAGVELVNRYGRVRSDRAALRALVDESKQFWPTT